VNAVTASFNTITGQMAEMSQRKKSSSAKKAQLFS